MEDRTRRALHYGAIGDAEIMKKFEETDMGEYQAENDYNDTDTEYLYKSYARNQVVDRNPDAPYFESDKQVRNPQRAAERLNLQYNADRGATGEIPVHPELFIGHMERDPRGTSNDPLLYKAREYISGAKAARLQIPMGNNDDNHTAERPWEDYSIIAAKQTVHKIARNRTKIFAQDRFARSTNNNTHNIDFTKYYGAGDNTIRTEIFKDNDIYRMPASPEDAGGIYSKIDVMTQLKQQLIASNYQARGVLDDIISIQREVAQMSAKGESVQAKQYTAAQPEYIGGVGETEINQLKDGKKSQAVGKSRELDVDLGRVTQLSNQMTKLREEIKSMQLSASDNPDDLVKIKFLSDQLNAVHTQLNSIAFRGDASLKDVTKHQYQSHLLGKLSDEHKTIHMGGLEPGTKEIHNYGDVEVHTDNKKSNVYKTMNQALDDIKAKHLPQADGLGRAEQKPTATYKTQALPTDTNKNIAQTQNGLADPREHAINNGSKAVLPKSQRRVQMAEPDEDRPINEMVKLTPKSTAAISKRLIST